MVGSKVRAKGPKILQRGPFLNINRRTLCRQLKVFRSTMVFHVKSALGDLTLQAQVQYGQIMPSRLLIIEIYTSILWHGLLSYLIIVYFFPPA